MNVTILLVVASCLIATGCCNTYYVVAPDGAPCPSSSSTSSCQELSNYTSQPSVFFTDNTVIYFLEGQHMLHQQDLVMISGVTNLTLQGLGTMETGPHETVTQSTVVIRCSRSTGGFIIMDSQSVTISTITVSGCASRSLTNPSSYGPAAMGIVNSSNTHLQHVSIQNASGYGLLSLNSSNLSIEDSSFYHNQYPVDDECARKFNCPGGNARVVFKDFFSPSTSNNTLNIIKSNFSFGFGISLLQGSGLSIELDITANYHKVEICIDEVVAYGNTGAIGANIYISASSYLANYKIYIKNTLSLHGNKVLFDNFLDTALIGAGLYFAHSSHMTTQAYLSIFNSTFAHNQADTGAGGLYDAVTANNVIVRLENCNFLNNTGNVGSALYMIGLDILQLAPHSVSGFSVFLKNVTMNINQPSNQKDTSSLQSTMTFQNVGSVAFDGVSILNSLATGLILFGSNVIFEGKCTISNNSGIDGGGMALYGSSYIFLKPPVVVSLTDNHTSRYGGGLYVKQPIVPSQIAQCFFQTTQFVHNSGFATIAFSNNSADVAGSALYGGTQLDMCISQTNFQAVFQLSNQPGPSTISSDPIDICLCSDNDEVLCNTSFYSTSTFPGGEFMIFVVAVGNLNGLTPATLVVHFSNKSVLANTSASCKRLAYTLTVTDADQTEIRAIVSLESILISTLSRPRSITVSILVKPCPIGFELDLASGICECSNQVNSVLSNVSCNAQTETITRTGDVWVGYSNESDCTLVSTNCPFDYCNQESVSFFITDPDPQCRLNRSGMLCGGCDNGLSLVLGTNRCAECSNVWLTLLLPFAVAGIALVAFLIALNLTVSVGTINGLIFYANIVKIEESFLFLKKEPIPLLSQFISWINLDLGIAVCFFDGMSACSKAWLQYVFPIYIWLILAAIVIFARFSQRLLHLVGSNIVPVLSTLLLLSYTKLIRNVILAMYMTRVSCDTASNELAVWSLDGNNAYFSGCHLPLFIVALLVLIFLIIPYTLFLVVSPFIEAYLTGYKCFRWVSRLKPVMDAYGGPYSDKFRVWTGFMLLVRVLLALITSLSNNRYVSIGALMCTMVILLTIHYIAGKVYNKWYLNALEISFLLNLILLGYFKMAGKEGKEVALIILLSMSLIMFLGIVLYHIALRVKPDLSTEWLYETMRKAYVLKKCSKTITNGGGPDVVVKAQNVQDDKGDRESLLCSEFHEFVDGK